MEFFDPNGHETFYTSEMGRELPRCLSGFRWVDPKRELSHAFNLNGKI